jgi:hypothetical protein
VSAQAAGYLKHSLDGFGASFFHHIGGAKFLSQRNAVAMVAQHYHLLGSKSARCHYAAQSYRAVTSSFATGKEKCSIGERNANRLGLGTGNFFIVTSVQFSVRADIWANNSCERYRRLGH